jgi:hypothetical protein
MTLAHANKGLSGSIKAMHRMGGARIGSRLGWLWMPLIGDLDR